VPSQLAYATAGAATARHSAMLRLCDAAGLGPKPYRDCMLSRIPVEREPVAKYRLKEA
jgi:hypothetical protein